MTWFKSIGSTSYHICALTPGVFGCMVLLCGGAGQEVAVPELSESIKIAVLKGTLSHLLDQEVRPLEPHPLEPHT